MERKKNRVSKDKERKWTYRGLLSQMIGTKCDEERKNVILLAVPKNLERCVHRREMRPCSNFEISLHNETPLLKQQYICCMKETKEHSVVAPTTLKTLGRYIL